MWAMTIALLMFGVLAVMTSLSTSTSTDYNKEKAQAIAQNFVDYRNAVTEYAENNPAFTGVAPTASLNLPFGWQAILPWTNKINSSFVLTWGAVPPDSITQIQDASQATVAIGIAEIQGPQEVILVPSTGNIIVIPPGSVPVGDIASALIRMQ